MSSKSSSVPSNASPYSVFFMNKVSGKIYLKINWVCTTCNGNTRRRRHGYGYTAGQLCTACPSGTVNVAGQDACATQVISILSGSFLRFHFVAFTDEDIRCTIYGSGRNKTPDTGRCPVFNIFATLRFCLLSLLVVFKVWHGARHVPDTP